MDALEWIKLVAGFKTMSVNEKLIVIGYYLNEHLKIDRFGSGDVNNCFDKLHLNRPSNASSQLGALSRGLKKRLLKDSKGYRLTSDARDLVAAKLKPVHAPKEILAELKALQAKISDPQQKIFLQEALVCFANEAYRASIVMAWNLAYHHVTSRIFDQHLADFNARLKIQFAKETEIKLFTDFEDMKESIFIAVVKGGSLVTSATAKTMKAKLDIRNSAAHPSSTVISPITAEEVITDLVKNILLRPTL
jgi:hypothetical protein